MLSRYLTFIVTCHNTPELNKQALNNSPLLYISYKFLWNIAVNLIELLNHILAVELAKSMPQLVSNQCHNCFNSEWRACSQAPCTWAEKKLCCETRFVWQHPIITEIQLWIINVIVHRLVASSWKLTVEENSNKYESVIMPYFTSDH